MNKRRKKTNEHVCSKHVLGDISAQFYLPF